MRRVGNATKFKASVTLAPVKGVRTPPSLAKQLEVRPNPIAEWTQQLVERPAEAHGGAANAAKLELGKLLLVKSAAWSPPGALGSTITQ